MTQILTNAQNPDFNVRTEAERQLEAAKEQNFPMFMVRDQALSPANPMQLSFLALCHTERTSCSRRFPLCAPVPPKPEPDERVGRVSTHACIRIAPEGATSQQVEGTHV